MSYNIWPSTGCVLVVVALAIVGLLALAAGAWWLLYQISIVWGGP